MNWNVKLISGIFTIVFLFIGSVLIAQSIPDVSALSDDEVVNYWKQAQSNGITIDRVKTQALSEGLSAIEADLLVSRILEVSTGSATLSTPTSNIGGNGSQQRFQSSVKFQNINSKLFGLDLFSNAKINFNPLTNSPTPDWYVLGAGDRISIQVYGSSQENYDLTLTPEGNVVIPLIGPVTLAGLSVEAAKSRLSSVLKRIYAGLGQRPQTVFLELTLSKVRSIRINIIGEVKSPGTFNLPSTSNSFTALHASGGPTAKGTFRNIKLFRSGKLIEEIDLYDFLRNGIMPSAVSLRDDDILMVGAYYKQVEISGLAKLGGIFEIKPEEGIEDLINLAGGFGPGAITNTVTLERLNGETQIIKDLPVDDQSFVIEDGDRILIRRAQDALIEKVQIEGAVLRPGTFGWQESGTLGELLEKAGGFTPEAYDRHLTLFRKKLDLSTEVIALDLTENRNQVLNTKLQIGDLVVVPSHYELSETPYIQVSGEVLNEGILPFFNGMTISDAIVLSSGLTNSSFSGSVELVRRPPDLKGDFEVMNFPLKGGVLAFEGEELSKKLMAYDHIFVRQTEGVLQPEIVEILGEVIAPGEYVLRNRETRISELYERSGGITQYAFVDGAYVLRPYEKYSSMTEAKVYLQQLERLNLVLKNKLAGGTLSNVETIALEKRLDQLRGRYRQMLINDNVVVGDSVSFWTLDSVYTDLNPSYDKVAFSLKKIIDKNIDPANDLILRHGDKLVIPTEPQTVEISGEVLNGRTIARYQAGLRLKDYIGSAGGYTSSAKRRKAYVIYQNGSASRTRNFLFFKNNPKVLPGTKITVPGGRVRENFNLERVFGLVTTAATTYLLFVTIQDRQSN